MSSTNETSKPLVAFFGATGGCAAATLTRALNAGYFCSALARNPSKLTSLLLSKGVSQSAMDSNLTITEGDVRDMSAVQIALCPEGETANIVISGIGIYAVGKITICAEAATTILSAIRALNPPVKPLVVAIATTGISAGARDVPVLYLPLYKVFLHNAHKDKRDMERLISAASAATAAAGSSNARAGEGEPIIRGFVLMRPTILVDGPALGAGKVRVGTESKPAVGYSVRREDVGRWIFEEVVNGRERERWAGERVSITS